MDRFNVSRFAVRESALTLFLVIVLTIGGIVAFLGLGRAEDPSFTVKIMTVSALWPGATAREMQDLVADPLERRLQELQYYDKVETYTRPGEMFMTVWIKDNTPPAQVPEQFYQARKKLNDAAPLLPRGVIGPFANDEYSDVSFALFALKATGLPQRAVVATAESLRQQLRGVPGVEKVQILGEQAERVFIDFAPAKLAALHLDPATIVKAVREQNEVADGGGIATSGPRVLVRIDRGFAGVDDIAATTIAVGGRTFQLRDIAKIHRGLEDPPGYIIHDGGEPALMLSVVMKPHWNGLELGRALESEAGAIRNELPLGYSFTQVADQSVNIREAVGEFLFKFGVALTVVMAVSLLALGFRVGIVVAASVPLTLAAVFMILKVTGTQLDRITLGALILALGLLVDDAIIAIEMMVVKMEEGWNRIDAAGYAWTATAAPMLSGTLVTIIALMPVGFASSTSGEYAGNIFWVVGYALLVSWFVAVYFTPWLGVKLLPAITPRAGGHEGIYQTAGYRRLRAAIAWAVDNARRTLAITLGALLIAGVLMILVPKQFFPATERPEVIIDIQMPEGTAIGATQAVAMRIEHWLLAQPEAKVVDGYIGAGAPRFFLALNPELPDPAFAKIVVRTADARERDALIARLDQRVADGLYPEARIRVTSLLFGPPVPSPVALRLSGPDEPTVRRLAAVVEDRMRTNPDLRLVNSDTGGAVPTAHLILDQARLQQLGLTSQAIATQLQFQLSGVAVTQLREGQRVTEVVMRTAGAQRTAPDRLGDLSVLNAQGSAIPFAQIGKVEIRPETEILRRRNRVPTITLRADPAPGVQAAAATAEVEDSLRDFVRRLPPGYQLEHGGVAEESDKSNLALAAIIPIMLLLMLVVIMIQVRSFRTMAMVVATAPLGLIGTGPLLLLFNRPFGFTAILGLIGLAGILMRNTLILVAQVQVNRQAGLADREAVIEATVQRARPVLLTALAAVLAFIPLATSSFWGAMALTLIGGTAAGTLVTLFALPAMFKLFDRDDGTGRLSRDAQLANAAMPK